MPGERLLDYDLSFFRGMKSDADPGQLALGYYWLSMNMLNIGGLLSCRPGYRCVVKFPKGNLQGAALFRPNVGLEQMIVAVDGVVYAAQWPFTEFHFLPNVQLSPSAKQVFWALTTQSATRNTADFSSAITLIPSRPVLIMQDGGETAPAWYDGSNSGHDRDTAFGIPAGGPMVWVGDRLFVAKGRNVLASDISNPFSFREQIYLGGISGFVFDFDVTAMAKTTNLDYPQLVVFTHENANIVQANIRDRNLWPTTTNMQVEVFKVGCTSQRSIVSHFGRLSWFSPSGVMMFDAATQGRISSRLPVRDNEMLVSKSALSEDLSLVAGGAFGQYLLMSVPAEDNYNRHTWVVNDASYETINDDSGPSWAGYWTGTRPVEWVYGDIAGTERIFYVSTDHDGENRLWEAFRPDRLDNGCPITWAMATRGYFGPTGAAKKTPGSDCKMGWADVSLSGIEEDLDLGVFYAGSFRGTFKPILAKRISVARGGFQPAQLVTATSTIFAFKPQYRVLHTEDASQQSALTESGSCPVESPKLEDQDESFQLLVVGHGPAAIRWIRVIGFTTPDNLSGDGDACLNEANFNAVRFDGVGVRDENLLVATELLAAKAITRFTSTKTETVTQDGLSAVGIGSAESIISQGSADRVASIIAVKQAEAELLLSLAPVLSTGEGFDDE